MPKKIIQCKRNVAPKLLAVTARSRGHQVSVDYDLDTTAVTLNIEKTDTGFRIGKYSFIYNAEKEQEEVSFWAGGYHRLECYRLMRFVECDIAYARGAL